MLRLLQLFKDIKGAKRQFGCLFFVIELYNNVFNLCKPWSVLSTFDTTKSWPLSYLITPEQALGLSIFLVIVNVEELFDTMLANMISIAFSFAPMEWCSER